MKLADAADPDAIVLVEGASDQNALEALAERRGRNLEAEGVLIVPMGGATTIGHYLDLLGPSGFDVKLAGLCDVGEEGDFRRGLERSGVGSDLDRPAMEDLGFFVCVADLEDELIRALGTDRVEAVIEAQGEMGTFRLMQKQPAQRERARDAQLRRFMGTRAGRKVHYARLLVEAVDLASIPRPLDGVLASV
ncbi:MAG: TOPRIM nucleotidyl transferase/hydrolase domain-containing protein [Acidimicrobiia bacterium]